MMKEFGYLQRVLNVHAMKNFRLWAMFLAVAMALAFFTLSMSSSGANTGSVPIVRFEYEKVTKNRKLKGSSYFPEERPQKNRGLGNINLDDYHRIDPAPSSREALKSGPIEHGTPLMPYIPQPVAPSPPKEDASP